MSNFQTCWDKCNGDKQIRDLIHNRVHINTYHSVSPHAIVLMIAQVMCNCGIIGLDARDVRELLTMHWRDDTLHWELGNETTGWLYRTEITFGDKFGENVLTPQHRMSRDNQLGYLVDVSHILLSNLRELRTAP